MKKVIFIIFILILSACSPQVTVTSQVTVTLAPPTETLIPTPTLHPQFIELQNFFASSERYILLPDGTIEEQTADGGRQTIPNLNVDQNGVINIIFNNERVVIETSQISFDDEGLTIDGYELNENGEWVEAVSRAMQMATEIVAQYGLDPETVTIEDMLGGVRVSDTATGEVLFETNGFTSKYSLPFAVDTIAKSSCEATEFEPRPNDGLLSAEDGRAILDYLSAILDEIEYPRESGSRLNAVLINRDKDKWCWGSAYDGKDLVYRDSEGVIHKLTFIKPVPREVMDTFKYNR